MTYDEYRDAGGTLDEASWNRQGRPFPPGYDPGASDDREDQLDYWRERSAESNMPFRGLMDDPDHGSLDSMWATLTGALGGNFTSVIMQRGWDSDSAWGEFQQIFDSPQFSSWLQTFIWDDYNQVRAGIPDYPGRDDELYNSIGPGFYASMEGQEKLARAAWNYIGTRFRGNLGDYPGKVASFGSGGGRGSGGGVKPLTPDEIRAQFDVDQLADITNSIWRNMLLEDNPKARDIAKAYVEEVVRTGGKKQIDFDTYIKKRARNTSKYASIYPADLGGLSEEQYIGQYYASAGVVAGGEQQERLAIQGAQLGASQDEFQGRLNRESRNQGSNAFLQSFGRRLGALSGVLKG